MSRPIVLSNGEMHVGINESGLVHDFYYPYVGGENHVSARSLHHRIGVWVDGVMSWLDDGSWSISHSYLPETLIGHITARNQHLEIALETTDVVDAEQAAFIRNIHIINLSDHTRDVRLFMHQVFVISNSYASDTAQYLPEQNAIVHYKGLRTFIVGGMYSNKRPFDQFAVGLNGIEGHEGSYRDADDGELSGNAVEHGRVDSVVRYKYTLKPHDSERAYYWIAAGKSQREALKIHERIQSDGPLHRLLLSDTYWKEWLTPARNTAQHLPEQYRTSFLQSVLLVKSHLDKRGTVIASTDTTMLNYSRDSYAYCWPRDGAYVIWPLLRLGYTDEPLHYFMFCRRVLNEHGYLMHKYQPDGALGSSWHPYIQQPTYIAPPIQEDESAIVLFLFSQYYALHKDEKLLREFYSTLIAPIANFLASYIGENKLPLPSYDLWERLFQTTTYTTAVVYEALNAAARLADAVDNEEDALRWRMTAEDIKDASHVFVGENNVLIKGIRPDGSKDVTIDVSSAFGAFMFGLFDDTTIIDNTYQAVTNSLASGDGLARFADDEYNRFDPNSVGNPWFIASLWVAQHQLERGNIEQAYLAIDWVKGLMSPTGVLAEQLDPLTHAPLSVAPLAWSQAEYVSCLLDTIQVKDIE